MTVCSIWISSRSRALSNSSRRWRPSCPASAGRCSSCRADRSSRRPAARTCAGASGRDSPDAWRRAFANRREQAWSPGEFGLVEHVGRAGTHRECAQQFVQRLSQLPHLRVGAEVAGVPSLAAAGDPYAGHGLPRRYRQIRVGLVVAELHVETGDRTP